MEYVMVHKAHIASLEARCAALRARIDVADAIILRLTADHNTGPNYLRGFDMAHGYFAEHADSDALKGET